MVSEGSEGFDSPEAAALATWQSSPSAGARVMSVDIRGTRAEVIIEVGPSYSDWVYCINRGGRWFDVISGNGSIDRWDDPESIQWR